MSDGPPVYPRTLYRLTAAGAQDHIVELLVPIPSEETLDFLARQMEVVKAPELVTGYSAWRAWITAPKPKQKDVAAAFQSIASLLEMGVPLVDCLAKTIEITSSLRLKHALASMIGDLNTGFQLDEAMAHHPTVFDRVIISQVSAALRTAGVKTASVAGTLNSIAAHIESVTKVKAQAMVALIYPAGVVTILYCVISGMLLVLMPRLTKAFVMMNVELPGPSKILVEAGKIVEAFPAVLLAGPALVVLAWCWRDRLARPAMSVLRRLPVFGAHYIKSQLAVAIATMAGLLKSGIPLNEAVNLVGQTMADAAASKAFYECQNAIEAGDKPHRAFTCITSYFGRVSLDLKTAVELGHHTSQLPKMLEAASVKYHRDFLRSSEVMSKVIEPIATVVVGLIVSAIVMAAYYPILTASNNIR
jgi:type II secretory pathway component PulF